MYLPVAGQARPALDLKTVQRFGKAMMRIMKFAPAHRVDLGNDAGVPMSRRELHDSHHGLAETLHSLQIQSRPGLPGYREVHVQRFGKAMMRIMKFAPAHRVDLGNDAGVPMGSEEPPRGSAAWALDADDELPLALRIGTIVKEVVLIHALSE